MRGVKKTDKMAPGMTPEEWEAYNECQMLPQAQYMMRMKRELARDKKARTYNKWLLIITIATLVATIIGLFLK